MIYVKYFIILLLYLKFFILSLSVILFIYNITLLETTILYLDLIFYQ